ncbi:MAG: hypothetical protein M3075_14380 [Candidatus Dormibacteraeota bacterium]|nr:hypothetical protein [Candidatus Dormibacteraeota bacterium]MDQ6920956.1 hypothetical protein [Candidatus Dormibacteraeota bacterium]
MASVVKSAFGAVAARQGAQLVVRDVQPLPAGDTTGIGAFYFLIICTLGGYLVTMIIGQAAPSLRPRRRYSLILGAAVATPVLVYLIGALLGVYTKSPGTVFALIGVGALYTLIVGVISRALQLLLGQGAIFGMMIVFVLLNFPSAGGAFPAVMLPAFWRFLNGLWIGAAGFNAIQSVLYFGGQGVGTGLLKMLAWLLGSSLLLALPVRKREQLRARGDAEVAARAVAPALD